MSECYVDDCEKPSTTLVQVDTSNTPGAFLRMRRFCDDHKPPPGTVLQPDEGEGVVMSERDAKKLIANG